MLDTNIFDQDWDSMQRTSPLPASSFIVKNRSDTRGIWIDFDNGFQVRIHLINIITNSRGTVQRLRLSNLTDIMNLLQAELDELHRGKMAFGQVFLQVVNSNFKKIDTLQFWQAKSVWRLSGRRVCVIHERNWLKVQVIMSSSFLATKALACSYRLFCIIIASLTMG